MPKVINVLTLVMHMEIIRKRVRLGSIITFVDPRRDLILDNKKRLFLHYLPESNEETNNKNSLRYQLVRFEFGYYIKFLGFFDFETAVRNYVKKLVTSPLNPPEVEKMIQKNTRRLPYRAREIIDKTLQNQSMHDLGDDAIDFEENTDWVVKVAKSFSIRDFFLQNGAIIKGKSGSEHVFDLVVISKEKEDTRIAFLNKVSDDMIKDIILFNALANDCDIKLKVISVNRDLKKPAISLLNRYGISVYDKRSDVIIKPSPQQSL